MFEHLSAEPQDIIEQDMSSGSNKRPGSFKNTPLLQFFIIFNSRNEQQLGYEQVFRILCSWSLVDVMILFAQGKERQEGNLITPTV